MGKNLGPILCPSSQQFSVLQSRRLKVNFTAPCDLWSWHWHLFEVRIAIMLHRNWRGLKKAGESGSVSGISLQFVVRILVFGIYIFMSILWALCYFVFRQLNPVIDSVWLRYGTLEVLFLICMPQPVRPISDLHLLSLYPQPSSWHRGDVNLWITTGKCACVDFLCD